MRVEHVLVAQFFAVPRLEFAIIAAQGKASLR